MGLADLHIHTNYSYDGTASVAEVLRSAKQNGMDVIAITDHDEIRGALQAVELASHYGVEVIPGIEITTAEGDLLALFITEKVEPGLSLLQTVLKVRKLGGICIAPHPMAGGFGMKSLSAISILRALRHPEVEDTLLGIEVYNATAIDRAGNQYARLFAKTLKIAHTGSSDAHVANAIGLGATSFDGRTAADLHSALKAGSTSVVKQKEWSVARILSTWAANYLGNLVSRLTVLAR